MWEYNNLVFFILLVGRIFSLSQIELNFNLQSTTYSSSNSLWIIIYCNLNYDDHSYFYFTKKQNL